MTTFLETFQKHVVHWLTKDDGGDVIASLSLVADDFVARAKLALMTRFPDYAIDDVALAALGRDRKIIRGINEPAAAYAARLIRALDDHRRRGNPFALLEQIRAYLQADCVVRTVDRRGNWFSIDADGNQSSSTDTGNWTWDEHPASPQWARFWVIIYPAGGTDPWARAGATIDGAVAGAWIAGSASQRTFDTTATQDQVAQLKSIIRDWKPAGTRCEWVIVVFDDPDAATFAPSGGVDPAGEWADWGDGEGRPVRLTNASYWAVGATKRAST